MSVCVRACACVCVCTIQVVLYHVTHVKVALRDIEGVNAIISFIYCIFLLRNMQTKPAI